MQDTPCQLGEQKHIQAFRPNCIRGSEDAKWSSVEEHAQEIKADMCTDQQRRRQMEAVRGEERIDCNRSSSELCDGSLLQAAKPRCSSEP